MSEAIVNMYHGCAILSVPNGEGFVVDDGKIVTDGRNHDVFSVRRDKDGAIMHDTHGAVIPQERIGKTKVLAQAIKIARAQGQPQQDVLDTKIEDVQGTVTVDKEVKTEKPATAPSPVKEDKKQKVGPPAKD